MKFFAVFALVAASLAAAGEEPTDSTTTLTSTLTKTMTITQCNPTYTDCPYATSTVEPEPEEPTSSSISSEEPAFPAHNSTIVVNSSSGISSTKASEPTLVTATSTAVVDSEPTETADTVSSSGAGSLYVSSGLLMGVIAAGAALL